MEKLIVPVYLNQRLVFDLLAMLQGGISTVTAVTNTESAQASNLQKTKATFGLSNALSSLLKIDLSGEKEHGATSGHGSSVSEERVHTPASLFYKLRNNLLERKFLVQLQSDVSPQAGDLVEFEASLSRNPIVETIESLSEMLNIVLLFEDSPAQHQKLGGKAQKQSEKRKVKEQMDAFAESLKAGNTIDLTANRVDSGHEAVITLETEFLSDPLMSDLVDGKFHVLGKVIRAIESPDESISLIRKTALSKMPPPLVMQAFSHLSDLASQQGFAIPALRWNIGGPAIQVLPIAIYA